MDRQGITGKKTEYKSCPYHYIKAFSVATAGGGLDTDCEMSVYSSGLEMNIDFDKEKVNIYEIQKYLSGHVFVDSTEDLLAYNAPNPKQTFTREEGGKGEKLLDFLLGKVFFKFQLMQLENIQNCHLIFWPSFIPTKNICPLLT